MSKRNKRSHNLNIESLDGNDFEDEGFLDGDVDMGTPIVSFNFAEKENSSDNKAVTAPLPQTATPADVALQENNYCIPNARGFTPSIDGEAFSVKRGYQLRPSTLIKLHELKNKHPDANVYFNTVLDAAILHFYNYIINENGSFPR